MIEKPTLTPKTNTPPAVQELCDRVHAVADGLPTLVFLPNEEHSRLYPLVVVGDGANSHVRQVNDYMLGAAFPPPTGSLRKTHDLTLEAIHAAVDYLPAIVFLPDNDKLYPVNLVPETVAKHLKPCYRAVQQAQKSVIGAHPIEVAACSAETG